MVSTNQRVGRFSNVRLAPGVSVFLRAQNLIQFGLDATRTGVIETPFAKELSLLISATVTPTPLHHLTRAFTAYVGANAAESMVADLVSFRILVPADPVPVILLGNSPLAKQLSRVLRGCGVEVRSPMRNTTEQRFVGRADTWVPVVAVDKLAEAEAVARMTKQRVGATVPVNLVDSQVFVGPLFDGEGSACLACTARHFSDVDDGWSIALRHFPAGPHSPDHVVLSAGAAAAAAYIRRVAGVAQPPGVSMAAPVSGELHVVDPFATTFMKRKTVLPHPRCEVCG